MRGVKPQSWRNQWKWFVRRQKLWEDCVIWVVNCGCKTATTVSSEIWLGEVQGMWIIVVWGKSVSLKMKERVYRSCVQATMLYEREAWRFKYRERDSDFEKDWERAMFRKMCGLRFFGRENPEDLMGILGMEESVEWLERAVVWVCVEERWSACSGKSVKVSDEGEERRGADLRREDALKSAKR